MRCPTCGFENLLGSDVCDNCGSDLAGRDVPEQAVSFSGQTITATRTDALASGGSYPALTLTVSVASNAPASVTWEYVLSKTSIRPARKLAA